MWKSKNILPVLIALALLLPAGCAGGPGEINASLGQEFTLAIGQSASIAGENLKVRFVDVTADSRCPTGAQCIWQGEASCAVEITYSGALNSKVLVQPGLQAASRTDFNNYTITYDVQPYPAVGKQIKKEDYRLQLTIGKKPA